MTNPKILNNKSDDDEYIDLIYLLCLEPIAIVIIVLGILKYLFYYIN